MPAKLIRLFVLGALGAFVPTASASPRPLPFTYTPETTAPGTVELQLHADLVPLRAISSVGDQTYLASAFQTEVLIGLLDRLDLTLAVTFVSELGSRYASTARFEDVGNGLRQRVRYLFADPEEWPVDLGILGELTENERAIEVEAKVLAQLGFERLRLVANLGVEYDLQFSNQRELVITPTLGATYELTSRLRVGIEGWLRGAYPQHPKPATRGFALGPHAYVGPVVHTSFGKLWWTVGAYGRVTDRSHDLAPSEPYGRIWIRSLIGYDL